MPKRGGPRNNHLWSALYGNIQSIGDELNFRRFQIFLLKIYVQEFQNEQRLKLLRDSWVVDLGYPS